jgi:hypothetical protein
MFKSHSIRQHQKREIGHFTSFQRIPPKLDHLYSNGKVTGHIWNRNSIKDWLKIKQIP